jgi:MioC protein
MPLVILTASVSGTAEFVAEEAAELLTQQGIVSRIVPMQKAALAMFAQRKLFLIVSSTYGTGDVPDNGQAFYRALVEARPDLSDVKYGIIGLGDTTYSETFCGGSARLDAIFSELGAKRIGERLRHDRRSGVFPEKLALEWLAEWIPMFKSMVG